MAFFCDETGVRIVAPGVSVSAGGSVPMHDGTAYAAAAEHAADCELAKYRDAKGDTRISPEIEKACLMAAMASLAKPTLDKDAEKRTSVRNDSKGVGKPASQ